MPTNLSNYIAGAFVPPASGEYFPDIEPATGKPLCEVPDSDKRDISLRLLEDGKPTDVPIRQGDIFLLRPKVPHSPQRPANTVGLVMEVKRQPGMKDGVIWVCEKCHERVCEEYFFLEDIVAQLKAIIQKYYDSEDLRTCKFCGHVQPVPGR